MLTVYHAPQSRSSRLLWLLEELGADYEVEYVTISRRDGSGGPDPKNPHPLKQTPAIAHHGVPIVESVIIWSYLTDLYPQAGMAPRVGEPGRTEYMAWLGLYGGVLEPAITAKFTGVPTPVQTDALNLLDERWRGALEKGPYMMGDKFSAVDILFVSLLMFARQSMPDHAIYDDWMARISARPARARALLKDAKP